MNLNRTEQLLSNSKVSIIKKCLPKKLKQSARNTIDLINFYRSINELKKISNPDDLSIDLIHRLSVSWGNTGWSLSEQAVKDIVNLSFSVNGSILECGSGLSTIILSVLHRNNSDIVIWSLEHDQKWHSKVNIWLKKLNLTNVKLIESPLIKYNSYDWYDISDLLLPTDLNLIICDGPPGSTRGGRFGAMPVLKEYLNTEFVIFLDDTCRLTENSLMNKWSELPWTSFSNIRTEKDYSVIIALKHQNATSTPSSKKKSAA